MPPKTLDAIQGHEACSLYPELSHTSHLCDVGFRNGKLIIQREQSAEMFFGNKYAEFRDQLPDDNSLPVDLVKFRKGEGVFPLIPESELSSEQRDALLKLRENSDALRRISTGIIDTYVDGAGKQFWIATSRDAGSGMGGNYQITLSGGGFHGSDILGGCVREMAEESPVILRDANGDLKLGFPYVPGKEHIFFEGVTSGIREFLHEKYAKFLSVIESDSLYQGQFEENFGIPYQELKPFLENCLSSIEDSIVWLDTTVDRGMENYEVSFNGNEQKFWVGDEVKDTRSYEIRLPVTVKVPNGYEFAGARPKLYLESTLQKPVTIDIRHNQGLIYSNPDAQPVETLRQMQTSMLAKIVVANSRARTMELLDA